MYNKLARITELANDLKLKFNAVVHHVNHGALHLAFKQLKKNRACGVDNVTLKDYESNLDNNISYKDERENL